MAAYIIFGGFNTIRTLADDFRFRQVIAAGKPVAERISPTVFKIPLEDLNPSGRNRADVWSLYQSLQPLLGGRVISTR